MSAIQFVNKNALFYIAASATVLCMQYALQHSRKVKSFVQQERGLLKKMQHCRPLFFTSNKIISYNLLTYSEETSILIEFL